MKKTIYIILCLYIGQLVSFQSLAQMPEGKYNKKKYLVAANNAFKEGSIFSATDLYLAILQNNPEEKSVLFNLAQSYLLARDYENAATYFTQAYQADTIKNTLALYYAALTTKMQGRYEEANGLFKKFIKIYKEEDATQLKKWARLEADGCQFAIKEKTPDPFVKLKHLGQEVNSNYGDLAPALHDGQLYFASINADTVLWLKPDRSDAKKPDVLMKLFKATITDEGYEKKEQVKQFGEEGKHISNPSFNTEGTRFFYTICDGGLLSPECAIYMSERSGATWSEGKKMNEEINLKGSTNTQPYLAKNNIGQEILYFVSNREGGKGGNDIWWSVMNKKGEFGTPRNLGSKVNTDRDEVTPFYDTPTGTLYFSSNGWISMGGADIYKTQSDASGKFTNRAENLGAPFNSACDDNYFRPGRNGEEGYLVSNRPGIYSVRGKTCCYDIFNYKYDRRIFVAVKGKVIDEATQQPIGGAAVNLSLRSENPTEADVTIANDTSTLLAAYFFNLKTEKLYKLAAFKDGYFTSSQAFSTQALAKSDTLEVNIYLKKLEKNKAYRLNNIYYDFDKSDLRAESKSTLDTLYNLLIENPTIIIELSAHTDVRGSDAYNLSLSQKRAESCVNYLIHEKKIPINRITAKGYGESMTLEDCTKYPDCPLDQNSDCPCHQNNRRTEFKITGELDGILINENE
jgi:OOP family OmpA-OmpF porin